MIVKWEVNEGFMGKKIIHKSVIPDEVFEDILPKDHEDYINACIQKDFENNVTWKRIE